MTAPLVLPVAEWTPDQPETPATGSAVIKNVFPRSQASYGPVQAPAAAYNALAGRCIGGCAFRDKLGNTFMFSGTASDLYIVKAGVSAWQNVSKSPGVYTGGEQVWNFVFFNGNVIGTDYNDPPQVYTLSPESALFADLGGNPPKGKYVAVVKNAFVVFGNTYDPINGEMPQRVWWSGAGDLGSWPALGTDAAAQVQSGAVDLLGPAGDVQGFAPDLINADAVVFMEYGVRRMMYAGPPDIFTFLPVENARGTPAPSSIVVSGGIAYYWGQDGIYAFDGGASQPIGANKVDKFLLGEGNQVGDVDMGSIKRVVGVADPLNKLIWWAYVSRNSPDGNPDRLLCYSWQLDRFSLVHVSCETLMRVLSIGYTLDELETVLGYMTLEEIPYSLDSDVWLGGKLQMGLFDANHTLSFLAGARLEAIVDTQELNPVAGRRVLVTNSRPLVDMLIPEPEPVVVSQPIGDEEGGFLGDEEGGLLTDESGADFVFDPGIVPLVSIGRRERLQDAVAFTTPVELNSMGQCPVRTSGRYMRGRITIPEGSAGWQNISGVELDLVRQGSR